MADNKVCSIRADEGTINKFKEITEQFPNGGECLKALITAHEIAQAKATVTGQETNISDFQAHIDSIVRAYIYSLDLTANTEERVREEFRQRIDSQAQTIADLQARLKTAEEHLTAVTAESNEKVSKAETDRATAQQTAESLEKELQQARKELEQEKKLSVAIIETKDRLQADINQFKEKASQLDSKQKELDAALQEIDKLTDEINKLKAEIEQIRKTKEQEINAALLIQQAESTQAFNQKISQLQEQHTQQIASLLSGLNQNFKSDSGGNKIDK